MKITEYTNGWWCCFTHLCEHTEDMNAVFDVLEEALISEEEATYMLENNPLMNRNCAFYLNAWLNMEQLGAQTDYLSIFEDADKKRKGGKHGI
jgi:hypothetical protein